MSRKCFYRFLLLSEKHEKKKCKIKNTLWIYLIDFDFEILEIVRRLTQLLGTFWVRKLS